MQRFNSLPKFPKNRTALGALCIFGVGLVLGIVVSSIQPDPESQAYEGKEVPTLLAQKTGFSFSSNEKDLLSFNQQLIAIAKKVKPAVVNISVTGTPNQDTPFPRSPYFDDPFFQRFFGEKFEEHRKPIPKRQQQGMGSGVIVSSDGYIVTNNHVVEAGEEVQVILGDKQKFDAKLIGTDPKTDLAILKIDASELPHLDWGDSSRLEVGEMVVAVGNPFGLSQTVTMGIISAVGRANVGIVDYEDFIQTDAAINPGNSGGALVNIQGELIGINTAIFSRSGGYMGIGFSIPSNMVQSVTQSLITHGKVVRGWLGVSIQDMTPDLVEQFDAPDTKGALVGDVIGDSPAEEAKFQRGDIIREYNGRAIETPNKLRAYVAETAPGTEVAVEILRQGKTRTLIVEIGTLPKDLANLGKVSTGGEDHALSGLTVEPLSSGPFSSEQGVRVTQVDPISRAAQAGIRKEDIILEINRTQVDDLQEFNRIAGQLQESDTVLVLLKRGNSTLFLSISGK